MCDAETIREAILDRDGSCRDVNFLGPSWDGVRNLLDFVEDNYSKVIVSGWDKDGRTTTTAIPMGIGESSHIHAEEGTPLVRQLQVFICRESDDSPFVEVTFFPQDVQESPDLAAQFCSFVDSMARLLRATKYFVRYENASWRFGDCGKDSGVIFSSQPHSS